MWGHLWGVKLQCWDPMHSLGILSGTHQKALIVWVQPDRPPFIYCLYQFQIGQAAPISWN